MAYEMAATKTFVDQSSWRFGTM